MQTASFFTTKIVVALGLTLLVSACQPKNQRPDDTSTAVSATAKPAPKATGKAAEAYQYLEQAKNSKGIAKAQWLYKAAETWLKLDNPGEAQLTFSRLDSLMRTDPALANPPQSLNLKVALLRAELGALRKAPAADILAWLPDPNDFKQSQYKARVYKVRAEAKTAVGDALGAARDWLDRARFLRDKNLRKENTLLAWTTLNSQPVADYKDGVVAGETDLAAWIELITLHEQRWQAIDRYPQALQNWRKRHRTHAASQLIIPQLLATTDAYLGDAQKVQRIVVLLPRKGRFAKIAQAVRQGIAAGWYQQDADLRPVIHFQDSGEDDKNVIPALKAAIASKADFIIGPLTKQGVAAVARFKESRPPILALNRLPNSYRTPPPQFYQLALAPEDEGINAAERLLAEGYSNAIALVPDDTWGSRIASAFRTRMEQGGGRAASMASYDPNAADHSRVIKNMLNVDDSRQRWRNVQAAVGRKLKFRSRARQDGTVLFLAAYPRQARMLKPQLKFHDMGHIPVYATSQVWASTTAAGPNRDLDGVRVAIPPWRKQSLPKAIRKASKNWSIDDHRMPLLMLGYDAVNLIGPLRQPQATAQASSTTETAEQTVVSQQLWYTGLSGRWQMDERQRLVRRMPWAVIRRGKAQPLSQVSMASR